MAEKSVFVVHQLRFITLRLFHVSPYSLPVIHVLCCLTRRKPKIACLKLERKAPENTKFPVETPSAVKCTSLPRKITQKREGGENAQPRAITRDHPFNFARFPAESNRQNPASIETTAIQCHSKHPSPHLSQHSEEQLTEHQQKDDTKECTEEE